VGVDGVGAHRRMTRAAFVDRDGVINEPVWDVRTESFESPYRPQDVALVPGSAEALARLQDAGFKLVLVSNQPAAAKGQVTLDQLAAVHERVVELLGIELDAAYYCHHHPDGSVAALSGPCDCRKPAPGLLLRAAADHDLDLAASWMFGDADTDVEAAHAAGASAALIEHPRTAHRRRGGAMPELTAGDLGAAAAAVAPAAGRLPARPSCPPTSSSSPTARTSSTSCGWLRTTASAVSPPTRR
jgi:D-glycero-D-manno-heptose 1,7-bisphosphate phosphatase